jgi:hypothetical protein
MDDVEQFSAESAQRLERATERLLPLITSYTAAVVAMRGGSSEMPALFDRNDELALAVAAWNDRVADHTGAYPLLLDDAFEDDEDDEDEDDEEPEIAGRMSVISRWDLGVVDPEALLAAGRTAHRHNRPDETEADAAAAVTNLASALYAITHDAGEPWFDVPGVEVMHGARVYLVPDEPLGLLSDDPGQALDAVTAPPGQIAFTEMWQ